jgi:hypothetical protein
MMTAAVGVMCCPACRSLALRPSFRCLFLNAFLASGFFS